MILAFLKTNSWKFYLWDVAKQFILQHRTSMKRNFQFRQDKDKRWQRWWQHFLAKYFAQAESLLHCLEWVAGGPGLHVNVDKMEYMRFYQRSHFSTLDGDFLRLMKKFTNLGSNVLSTEKDINTRLSKAGSTINRPSVIWKSDIFDKTNCIFPSCCRVHTTVWMNHLDADTAYWEKAWRQLYKDAMSYIKTIPEATAQKIAVEQLAATHLEDHPNETNKTDRTLPEELISDVPLWTSSHGQAIVGQPAKTFLSQICTEYMLEAMDDRDGWLERKKEWKKERERELGKSVRAAWHDDDYENCQEFTKNRI